MRWMRHYALYLIIGVAILAVTVVFALRADSRLHNDTANTLVTGIAAIGTLLAVGVALRTVQEAVRTATKAAQREEVIRHDAVRPILSVHARWAEVQFEYRHIEQMTDAMRTFLDEHGDDGSIEITVRNDGLQTAVAVQCLLENVSTTRDEKRYLQLRTPETARHRLNLPVGANETFVRSHPALGIGCDFCLTFFYEDVIGWLWQTRGRVELNLTGGPIPGVPNGIRLMPGILSWDIYLEPAARIGFLPSGLPD